MDDLDEEYVILLALLYRRIKRKRKRRVWINPSIRQRTSESLFYTLFHEAQQDEEKFFNFVRMSKATFDELVNILSSKLKKSNTTMRESIQPEERLVIALRYLATGCSITDLHAMFRIGKSTASVIIREVCKAICTSLTENTLPEVSKEKWLEIARDFDKYADFPHCIGAVGGKHIRITPNSRSKSYKYKGYSSIVLLAVCDVNYKFTYVDIGDYGKSNYSGVYKNSNLYYQLNCDLLKIPPPTPIGNYDIEYPYVIVGDKAFSLSENLMRPYTGRNLTEKKQIFNSRLSRIQCYIERCFEIFTHKWQIFHKPLSVDPSFVKDLIKTTCLLHNFVLQRDGTCIDATPLHTMGQLKDDTTSRSTQRAMITRNNFADYFKNCQDDNMIIS